MLLAPLWLKSVEYDAPFIVQVEDVSNPGLRTRLSQVSYTACVTCGDGLAPHSVSEAPLTPSDLSQRHVTVRVALYAHVLLQGVVLASAHA